MASLREDGLEIERKEERMRQKKLHELPYTEIVKSGTIRLIPGGSSRLASVGTI